MKKVLALVLALILVLSLVACGGSGEKKEDTAEATEAEASTTAIATVTTNTGETKETTFDELINEYDGNEASFNKNYHGAKISFKGTVDKIKTNTEFVNYDGESTLSLTTGQNVIFFKEGWCLVIGDGNKTYNLADYNVGDTLEVTTSIIGAPYDTDGLKELSNNNRVMWLIGTDKVRDETNPCKVSTATTISKVS